VGSQQPPDVHAQCRHIGCAAGNRWVVWLGYVANPLLATHFARACAQCRAVRPRRSRWGCACMAVCNGVTHAGVTGPTGRCMRQPHPPSLPTGRPAVRGDRMCHAATHHHRAGPPPAAALACAHPAAHAAATAAAHAAAPSSPPPPPAAAPGHACRQDYAPGRAAAARHARQ